LNEQFDKGKRERTNISTTAKGLLQPEFTIELLNQDKVITVNSKTDVGDINEDSDLGYLFKKLDTFKEMAKEKGYRTVFDDN